MGQLPWHAPPRGQPRTRTERLCCAAAPLGGRTQLWVACALGRPAARPRRTAGCRNRASRLRRHSVWCSGTAQSNANPCRLTMKTRLKQALTKYAIELMGFQPIPQGQLIVGVFFSIHVYEVRGFTVEADALSWHSECVRGDSCQVAFGSSVNEICKKLASDSFTDNEAEWQEIHKCTPPYLVIILGPTQEYQASGTYFKTHEQTIETYDCFRAAKNELESKQYSTLPSLLSALACSFDISDYPIQFLP